MSDLEKLRAWLQTYPGADKLTDFQVDYTDRLPGCFGVFPAGLVEVARKETILGDITVQNQYNFALYLVLPKAPGDDVGASINADWVMDFQRWVQAQSVTRRAPTFGNVDEDKETLSAQNGALYDADEEGAAMYMVSLQAVFRTEYPAA